MDAPAHYDLAAIRASVHVPTLLANEFGEYRNMINCWYHDDSSPSVKIYDNGGYCHGPCQKTIDCFDIVRQYKKCSFGAAIYFLMKWANIHASEVVQQPIKKVKKIVPRQWIDYWHACLTDESLEYLLSRGITRATIEENLIGYRPDHGSLVFPYWSGVPQGSDVATVQFRSKEGRYYGENGYYYPCVLNQHLLNDTLNIFVFGTVDSYVGVQWGLPIMSINGVSMFGNSKKEESIEFRLMLKDTQRNIFIPDNTVSEFAPVASLMQQVLQDGTPAEIQMLPLGIQHGVKDFNDLYKQMSREEYMACLGINQDFS